MKHLHHLLILLLAGNLQAQTNSAQLTTWFTSNSGKYARVYTTTANRTSGTASTTWNTSGSTLPHTSPSYSDVYEISYSTNWVYAKYTGLPSYVIGPWLNPQGAVGNFWPGTQAGIRRFPRTPSVQSGTKDNTAAGASGIFVNGVAAFNAYDGWAWDGSADVGQAQHTTATYYWHRVAPVAESYNFDYTLGHQLPAGLYHNHQDPIALRYQLGDFVTYNSSTKNYSISAGSPSAHSPIIGWAHDGYPIYGPYGYSSALDSNSGVRRMVSGYVKRNGGTAGVDTVTSNTTTMPAWYTRYRTNHSLTNGTPPARSTNTATYPIGTYAQDWAYLGDLIKTGSTYYAQGTDFDLNEQNVRYCVTPEYPSGTWAYFITLDSTGAATYPYVFAYEFYGDATGGSVASISESVTTYFTGGPNTPITFTGTPTASGGTVTLTWNSVEGSTYTVENSTNQSSWTTRTTGLAATSNATTTSNSISTIGSTGTEYGRVTRTALATYDTTGVGSATVNQTGTGSYLAATNNAPTLTSISNLTGATNGSPFTISYASLAAAANEADADGHAISFQVTALGTGTLTKSGSSVTVGTLLSSAESFVWTPSSTGTVTAFSVKAYDGYTTSSTAIAVNVVVGAANNAPTLTTISTLNGATEDTAFTISYATLAAAANEADADGNPISFQIEAVSSGNLTLNGSAVTPGTTKITSSDSVVWSPAANANGTLAAFTVKAHDGFTTSNTAITVNVNVNAVAESPTLTTITTLSGAVLNTAFNISYTALAAAADENDPDGTTPSFLISALGTGTLTKNSSPVVVGSTTLSSGETLVWTPTTGFTGTTSAFYVKVTDGTFTSSTSVAVNIIVTATAITPQLTSWFTTNSGKYARIYTTTANETTGTTATTWSRGAGVQSNPVYSDISEVNYSSNWVYIRTSGLASHLMGPWYLDAAKTQLFGNYPANRAEVYRIPRTPTIPGTKSATQGGSTGKAVNGVSLFDSRDSFSYSNSNSTDASPTNGITGDGIWNRDAYYNESVTFDPALAHQAGSHYHYHAHPIALRYQLGDHVEYNATTNRYTESAAPVTSHSPILGWANDGLPVYGPYGYSSALDANSGVRRMISGFNKRDGTNGTTAITVRQTLPLWAQRFQNRTTLSSGQYGPAVNATYPVGRYIEDFDYRGDLGQTQGVDFDLNEYNVRYCVTPEYPGGTWAYFTPINADGTPMYPYTTGRQYYGSPTGGATTTTTMNADLPLTQQFIGGPNKPLTINGTPSVSSGTVTLTWNAVEGGTYSVDASLNNSTWSNKATGLISTGNTRASSYSALSSMGTEYARVNRTALATYDTNGFTTAPVSQTTTTSFVTGENSAPTLTSINILTGATEDTAFTIHYTALASAANEADVDGDPLSFRLEAISSGTLTQEGEPVAIGTLLSSGSSDLIWTPAANAFGTLPAFTVKAWDGTAASATAVQVQVQVEGATDGPIWSGGAGTNAWGTATNWLDQSLPATTDVLLFQGATPSSIDLGVNRTVGGLQFSGDTAYTLENQMLILNGNITTSTPSTGSVTHAIGSSATLGTAATFTTENDTNLTLESLSGSAALNKSGPGKLQLTDASSYTGALNIQEGTVQAGTLASQTTLAASSVSNEGALILYSASTFAADMSGNGSLNVIGSGGTSSLFVTGSLTHTGGTSANDIVLCIGNGGTTGSISESISLQDAGLVINRSDAFTLTAPVIGNGQFYKEGTNTVTLGSSVEVNQFDVAEGTLIHQQALSVAGQYSVGWTGSAATSATSAAAQITAGSTVVGLFEDGSLSLSGGADMTTGTLQFGTGIGPVNTSLTLFGVDTSFTSTESISVAAEATAQITVTSAAKMYVAEMNNVPVTLSLFASLYFTEDTTCNSPIEFANIHSSIFTEHTVTLSGPISGTGTLIKSGSGTLSLVGTHTRTGETVVDAGTLSISTPTLSDTQRVTVVEGATLDLAFSGTDTIEQLILNGREQAEGTWGSLSSSATYKSEQITGDGILLVTTGPTNFPDWAALYGMEWNDEEFLQDYDMDGIPNGVEFPLGGDPTSNDATTQGPTTTVGGGNLTLTFTRADESENDIILQAQSSTDLVTWTTMRIQSGSTTSGGATITVEENGEEPDSVTVQVPMGSNTKLFLRLTAERD